MPVTAGSIFAPQPASAAKVFTPFSQPISNPQPVSAAKVSIPSDDEIKKRRAERFADVVKSSNPASRFVPDDVFLGADRLLFGGEHLYGSSDSGSSGSTSGSSGSTSGSFGSVPVPSGPSAASVDYFNAELSKLYGMDKNVAYQEALANTAYQRAVKDMQAAGLNPASLFGAGRASPADGVGYVGASGGHSGGRSSARAQSEYGMSKGEYTKLSGVAGLIGTVGGAVAGYFIPGLTPSSGAALGGMASQSVAKIISQL